MSIYKKIAEAKKEIGTVTKNSKNPHFKNTYADINALIDAVEPILLKNGLVLLQPIRDGKQFTEIHDTESETKVESYIDLPINQNPQQMGSAITYFRRYTLQSLLSLQAEDDDGQKASAHQPQKAIIIPAKATEQEIETAIEILSMATNETELNEKYKMLTQSQKANKEVIECATDIKANFKN